LTVARLLFPDAGSRRADDATGRPAPSRTYTVYAAATGSTLADIMADIGGVPSVAITDSRVTTDAYGYLPNWWGPTDGTDRLWVQDDFGSPRWPVDAVNNERLDALTTRVAAVEATVGPGTVTSVAGRSGAVTLTVADVSGAETPAGAQAKADAVAANLTTHAADTTGIHGIADTSLLETQAGATAKANAAQAAAIAASDPVGTAASLLGTHTTDTTAVHGITDTSLLETAAGAQAKVNTLAAQTIPLSQKGTALGVATLGADGKLTGAQLPAISLVDYLGPAANQAAMLALVGQPGDWTTRDDLGTTWVITGSDPSQLSDWTELSYPTAPVTSVAGRTGAVVVTKADVGLANADNTADSAKPISTAAQAALDLKAPTANPTFTGTVSGVSKSMVGLGNADNTSDANKPVSTAQQAALDLKAPLASPAFTGTVSGITKAMVGLPNVDNTADSAKPVSTAQATADAAVASTAAAALAAYVLEGPLTPLRFGAVGNGTTLDDAAFTAMMAALPSFGGHVFLPPNYHFRLSQTITLKDKCRWEGAGATSQITNSVTDMFTCSAPLSWMTFAHMRLNAGSGGGHMFNLGLHGMSKSVLDNLVLTINAPAKSLIVADWWLDNTISNSWLYGANNRSAPLLYLVSTTDNLSDNTFHDLVITDAGTPTTWAIWLEETSANLAFSNRFRGINFENPCGGAITLRGHIGYLIENCQMWDLHAPASNHLIYCTKGSGSGLANRNGRIRGIVRPSGTLGSGISDIQLGPIGNEYGTVVSECYGTGSATLRIDLQDNLGCRVEECNTNVTAVGYTPIFTVGAGAGSGASAALSPSVPGLYTAGIALTTGTSPAAGALVAVTSNVNGWMNAAPAAVLVTPKDAVAAAAGLYVSSITAAGFTISAANALPSSTVVNFAYHVVRNIAG
jgi:hypothetical protein